MTFDRHLTSFLVLTANCLIVLCVFCAPARADEAVIKDNQRVILGLLDKALEAMIENEDSFQKVGNNVREVAGDGWGEADCRLLLYGGLRVMPVVDNNGDVQPSLTFFTKAWIYKNNRIPFGPDANTSISLLVATQMYADNGQLVVKS